jgi:hypothetical protein
MKSIDEILALSVKEFGASRVVRRTRRSAPRRRLPRPRRTRDELLRYLRSTGFDSVRKLDAGRGKGDPTPYDYRREFGSWGEAKELAFGKKVTPELTLKYVALAIIQFGLWTREKYRMARRNRPDVLPSTYLVEKVCGSFSRVARVARCMSMRETLNAYMALGRRLGRIPSLKDCRRDGLSISEAVEFFGGKRELDDFIVRLEGR